MLVFVFIIFGEFLVVDVLIKVRFLGVDTFGAGFCLFILLCFIALKIGQLLLYLISHKGFWRRFHQT